MEYKNLEITIRELLELIETNKINLRPPYQRNYIWEPKDQRLLIDSILKGYPLPNFFIYKKSENTYEMVDGQQRATTIRKFYKGEFKNSKKLCFNDIDQSYFMDYRLNIVELANVDISKGESLEEFYYLVNKRGAHLNDAEVNKAYHHGSDFLNLIEELMDDQNLIDLELFPDRTVKRMNDRSLIEELVAYLFKGITDKRIAVEMLFTETIDEKIIETKKLRFKNIVSKIVRLDYIHKIKNTRYRQRNDFFTLFCFIDNHFDDSDEVLAYQYSLLVFFDQKGYIRPTNDECETFKRYAINCVTQSNSKTARLIRLDILEKILCNKIHDESIEIYNICNYLSEQYHLDEIKFKQVGSYSLIDLDQFC